MKRLLPVLLLMPLTGFAAQGEKLTAAEWGTPKSGAEVLSRAPVKKVLDAYAASGGTISLRHPGGDRGSAWAQELRSWLVALGIDSAHVVLEPGSGDGDVLQLEFKPAP